MTQFIEAGISESFVFGSTINDLRWVHFSISDSQENFTEAGQIMMFLLCPLCTRYPRAWTDFPQLWTTIPFVMKFGSSPLIVMSYVSILPIGVIVLMVAVVGITFHNFLVFDFSCLCAWSLVVTYSRFSIRLSSLRPFLWCTAYLEESTTKALYGIELVLHEYTQSSYPILFTYASYTKTWCRMSYVFLFSDDGW